jgi:hypothetical protein
MSSQSSRNPSLPSNAVLKKPASFANRDSLLSKKNTNAKDVSVPYVSPAPITNRRSTFPMPAGQHIGSATIVIANQRC